MRHKRIDSYRGTQQKRKGLWIGGSQSPLGMRLILYFCGISWKQFECVHGPYNDIRWQLMEKSVCFILSVQG